MDDMKEHIDELLGDLRRQRDELRVKMSLAKLEAMEEWRELQPKLARLEAKAKELGSATADASKDVGVAAKLLGEEISKGLKSIAKHI